MSPDRILREPIDAPSNWLGRELASSDAWIHRLSPGEVSDLERGLAAAKASGRSLAQLSRADFPLPVLGEAIAGWMRELQRGRGFLNVKGIPVERLSQADAELCYWGIGLHMGSAVSQNAAGDLLGHVRDTGADPSDPSVRLYKTRVELGFHCDGADLVALLCLRQGVAGGETLLVSTTALYNEILRRRPDLIELLYQPFAFDRNDEQAAGEPPFFEIPICRVLNERPCFFYIPWYIRQAQRHPAAPRLTAEQHELLDLIDAIAADPQLHLSMRLEPGEINFLKNDTALHARTEFVDHAAPEYKRHLLRLWLTAHDDLAESDAFLQQGIPKKSGVTSDADAP